MDFLPGTRRLYLPIRSLLPPGEPHGLLLRRRFTTRSAQDSRTHRSCLLDFAGD